MSCPTCTAERERADRIEVDLKSAETELRAYRRRVKTLQAELANERKNDPNAKAAKELFDYWCKRTGKKKGTVFGPKREAATLARLRQHSVAQLRQAIDGAAEFPYNVDGTRCREGRKDQRWDDLELIFRYETNVDRFAALVDKSAAAAQPAQVAELRPGDHERDPWARPLDRVIASLRREFGHDAAEPYVSEPERLHVPEWWAICPLHPTPGSRPLRITERWHGKQLDLACAAGCLPSQILHELRLLEWRRDQHDGPRAAEVAA